MPRPIYVLLIDCFLGLSLTYTCLFEHVRGHKKTVTFDKDFHKNKVHHHKVNHLPSQVPNHDTALLRANRKSFLTLKKFKIFSNDIRKDNFSNDSKDGEKNEQQNEQNLMSEKNDKWKKYYEDKRKKEILKDLDSSVRKRGKRSVSGSPGGGNDSVGEGVGSRDGGKEEGRDHRTGEEDGQNGEYGEYGEDGQTGEDGEDGEDFDEYEEDDEGDDGDEDDEGYDSYDTYDAEDTHDGHAHRSAQDKRDTHLDYPYDHEEAQGKNLFFANNSKNENAHGKFYDDRKNGAASNPPSISESINNIFSSKRTTKDFPLFFPLNNKPFENSNNKYFDKICSIPPNELINRFFENTSERVKEAVKNIIFNIIGNIQKYTIETSILITYDIYNFLLQIILTGYMIKNADYRLSLNESLYDQNNIIDRKEDDLFNLKKSFYGLFADIHKRSGEETLNASELSEPKNGSPQAQSQDGEDMQKSPNLDEKPLTNSNLQDHISNDDVPDQDGNPYSYEEEGHQLLSSESASYANGKNGESDNFPIINTKNYIIFLRKKIKSLEMQLKN
ncbi:hypothetical protein PCYB_101480 [Plasmodium cynomolgi strain B]|uniref:Uncharacterized protein n=1 Tax=Plasmodium cynomolgi (strain B) TaxID=1120755 RepID=K6UKG3_PLACD|nr:hypothetical protein PCYB_101480 [Plasmodium cynomolgi strain B]GAB66798.1 hypothetical protein PCYB_101480 [Plasmodium cynomolgi strain B]